MKKRYRTAISVLNEYHLEYRNKVFSIWLEDKVREEIEKENKKENIISRKSQRGVLLAFMKRNPELPLLDVDFQKATKVFKSVPYPLPFIGSKPGSRLSELKKAGLVDIIGTKECIMEFQKKCRPLNIYQINEKGMAYKMKD